MLTFTASSLIYAPVAAVWAFHERDDIFDLLAPPQGQPVVLRRTGKLEAGAEVEFLVPLGPFRKRWLARHIAHRRHEFFTDLQIAGPFAYWEHEHRFTAENGGTRLTDHIRFRLPFSPLSDWVAGWAVKRQLRAMFQHRHEVTRRYCQADPSATAPQFTGRSTS